MMKFWRIAFILMLHLKTTITAWPHDIEHANEQRRHAHHTNFHLKNNNQSINNSSLLYDDGADDDVANGGVHHTDWHRVEMMDSNGLYWLEWWLKSKEIYFRVTVNTQGFIGLGFSRKTGRMSGADMVLLWVDDRTGKANALVMVKWYARAYQTPILTN
uniref:DOMON domain-containing protein n=1 Tax=Glossina brevipalpis TaxID=37001 RepID=A0A1A9W0W9_9MUSC